MAAFLKRNCKRIKATSSGKRGRENLLMWLAWHSARYNACAIQDEKGKLVAVGVARTITDVVDARFPFKNDESGKLLYVEQVAATSNEGFKALLKYVQKRWSHCDKIMFHRSKNGSSNNIYSMQDFMRKAKV
jgi:hypothetical protein